MTRVIAMISCFIAALFLVPVQGDCNEIPEYESETEAECYVIVVSLSRSFIVEEPAEPLSQPVSNRCRAFVSTKLQDMQRHARHLPVRILNCVFRE